MNPIISTQGLKYLDILNYPDIKIQENIATFITGESGCGKSTLLKLINATILPNSGTIQFKNSDIEEINKIDYRKRVVLAPQEVYLTDGTIEDNFNFYYSARDESAPDNDKILKFLKLCCLDFTPESPCNVMSGGERQRVFLAIFLSFMPKVLLLDEPTSALDAKTAEAVLLSVKQFCKENNITMVAVCHSNELTQKCCDTEIRLSKVAKLI